MPIFNSSLYSFSSNDKANVSVAYGGIGIFECDWRHKLSDAWQSAVGTVASNKEIPYIPFSFYVTSTILACLILPRLLRGCYKYTMHDPSLPSSNLFRMQVPYEKSLWEALENPLRYLVIFMAFTKMSEYSFCREFLENVCSGLSIQFSKPFSLGDTVKVGSIEGQVVEMGLAATWLLNDEALHVMVPNSMFASQVALNKSRIPFHAMTVKIPIEVDGIDKIKEITNEIEDMLRSNPTVFLGKETPCCFLSQTENSSAELIIRCNLENTNNQELHSIESNIRLQSLLILKYHGVLSKV
ncbi:hypothetical protein LWI28_009006 [Acer negundo]|uniref:Mechanosensitive ion channel MscS domain-containing protein n=1 Tax=Acer negundo TaxID=4023 RepID=A0AAD5IYI2_ACENE|nr:hypothetical protein LWI28_009006 [Acer negundo]